MDTETSEDIRRRLHRLGMTQEEFAAALGIADSTLSRMLRGRRRPPEGFTERVLATLDRLERAEAAAEEARRRVLAEEDDVPGPG